MVLTLHERIFVTKQYFAHKLYKTVSKMFQAKFSGKDVPNKSTMSRIIAKFRQHGIVCNLQRDREKTALTPRMLTTVSSELTPNDPGTSKSLCQVVHEHGNEGLSYGTTHCALEALGLHPYRVRVVHELQPLDYDHCMMYCQWLLNFVQTRPGMLNDVFYTDEAWFKLSEYVNSPAPANLETLKANITREINADERRRKCFEARTSMYFGSGKTIRTFIIRLPHIFLCTVQF